ncbi:MAG: hypothetical protein H0Z32_06785 [Bacillaceae bacterium]|nr:hypothetical protein [Bacillaceae bacterium]
MNYRQVTPDQFNPMFYDIFDMFQPNVPPPPAGGPSGNVPPFGAGTLPENLPPPPAQFPEFTGAGGPAVQAVDPGSFYGCLYRLTYVRLENGRRFWFYPVYIGRRSVAGYRWLRRQRRWTYTGFDTRQVLSFQCR